MRNRKKNPQEIFNVLTIVASIIVCAVSIDSGNTLAADGATSGVLGTLPWPEMEGTRGKLLAGHVRLLGKTADQTIEDLQHGRLREFLRSYKQMIDAYNSLTDHVGNASEAIGGASMRIQLARESLNEVGTIDDTDPQTRHELEQDVDNVLELLLGKLASLRTEVERAQGEVREELLRQIQRVVSRVRQMDGLKQSLKQGGRALIPALADDQLGHRLEEVEDTLEAEQKMLSMVASSARLSVQTLSKQIQRTMLLLQVEASIPRDEIENLQQSRGEIQGILDEIIATHQRVIKTATGILAQPSDSDAPIDADQLLFDADQLLKQNNSE